MAITDQIMGVCCYSNSLTYAALQAGHNLVLDVEYPENPLQKTLIYYAASSIPDANIVIESMDTPGNGNPPIDYLVKFSATGIRLGEQTYNPRVIYSQPNVSIKSGLVKGFDNVFNRIGKYRPEEFVFVLPARYRKEIVEYFAQRQDGYRWNTIRVNAMALGVPIRASYFVVLGSQSGKIPVIEETTLNDTPSIWDVISDLETVPMDAEKGHSFLPRKGIQLEMLWDSIPLLAEGEMLYDVSPEKYPDSMKQYANKILKVQLPVRLSRRLPSPSVSINPKYIHPTQDRPVTTRELARFLGLPDTFHLRPKHSSTFRFLGATIPIPVCLYAFDLVEKLFVGEVETGNFPEFFNASEKTDILYRHIRRGIQRQALQESA
jgi:hypothetical protein